MTEYVTDCELDVLCELRALVEIELVDSLDTLVEDELDSLVLTKLLGELLLVVLSLELLELDTEALELELLDDAEVAELDSLCSSADSTSTVPLWNVVMLSLVEKPWTVGTPSTPPRRSINSACSILLSGSVPVQLVIAAPSTSSCRRSAGS